MRTDHETPCITSLLMILVETGDSLIDKEHPGSSQLSPAAEIPFDPASAFEWHPRQADRESLMSERLWMLWT